MSISAIFQILANLGFAFVKSFTVLAGLYFGDLWLTPAVLGLVLLFRRVASYFANVVQLGTSQSILKYNRSGSPKKYKSALVTSMLLWAALASALCLAGAIGYQFLSLQNFAYDTAISPIYLILYSICLAFGFISYSLWLSELKIISANISDWINSGIIFIIAIFIFRNNATEIILFLILASGFCSVIGIILFINIFKIEFCIKKNIFFSKTLIWYSLSRGATASTEVGVYLIGAWSLRNSPEAAGIFILAFSLVRFIQSIILPICQIIALKINHGTKHSANERHIFAFSAFSVMLSIVPIALFFHYGMSGVSYIYPNSGLLVYTELKVLIWSLPALIVLASMKTHIDLAYKIPWNFINCLIGIFTFILIREFFNMPATFSTVAMLFVMSLILLVAVFVERANIQLKD